MKETMSENSGIELEEQVKKAEKVNKLKTHREFSPPGATREVEQLFAPASIERESREPKPAGQFLSEIPQGLSCEQVGGWVEERLRRAESTDEFRQPESIGQLTRYINGYQFTDRTPQDEIERKKLVQLVEIRGALQNALLNLKVRNYEGFVALIPMLTGERLTILKEKLPGLLEAINILEGKDDGVENSQGAYFRLTKSEEGGKKQIEETAKNAINIARQEKLKEGKGINTNSIQDVDATFEVVKTLFHVSWMSSYYAGPIEQDINGRKILRDARIFKELNLERQNEDGDLKRYFENRKLWEIRRQERMKKVGEFIKDPKPGKPEDSLGDPASSARRLLDFPEDMKNSDPPVGNAQSLRYAAEIYALSLPHFFGYDSLKEFMEKSDKRGDTFRWANMVKGAGPAATALTDLVNEPLKGGEAVGDPKNFGNTIKNIEEVVNKYQAYLELSYRDLFSYANSRIIESVFKFANGNSPDRKKFFPRWPKFGTWFLNSVVEAFSSKFNPDDRDELKISLNSSDITLIRKELRKQGTSWLLQIFKAFGSQVIKNK